MNLSVSRYNILSVMGPHAGEDEEEIFNRKVSDIENVGLTFWLIRSNQAKPNLVQQLCKEAESQSFKVHCYFIDASSRLGASPTKCASSAVSYSSDSFKWQDLPIGLSPVTGRIDKGAYALVFDQIHFCYDRIDLWNYSNFFRQTEPIIFRQGGSSVCAIQKDSSNHLNKMKSNERAIRAVARLAKPYAVWLK